MRTTVNIDDRLLEWAKEVAKQRESSLGEIVDEALQLLLSQPSRDDGPQLPAFTPEVPGLLPGIDPNSNASLFEAADDPSGVQA